MWIKKLKQQLENTCSSTDNSRETDCKNEKIVYKARTLRDSCSWINSKQINNLHKRWNKIFVVLKEKIEYFWFVSKVKASVEQKPFHVLKIIQFA